MSQSAQFDAFYSESWQRLLVQTYATCGDLGLARESLRHAYVDAWHHWLRAEWQGPEDYVREAAVSRAQWRGKARAFQRPQRVTRDQRATLDAMQVLAPASRKAVVLACLSELGLSDIARLVGETEQRTLTLLDDAMAELSATLGIPEQLVAARLQGLIGAARAAAQPTPVEIRHQGVRRRRVWLGGGVAAAVGLTLLAGAFVHANPVEAERLPPALGPEVSKALLLEPPALQPLGKPTRWSVVKTSDNTKGTGINSFCQASRFADPQGLRAYVRTFQLGGKVKRQGTQTIELSRTERQSRTAYSRVLGWFSGCSKSHLQLLSTYDVSGVGDQATVLKLRSQGPELATYSVAVVRTGHILTWAAFTTAGARNPETGSLVSLLGNALELACTSKAAGRCDNSPKVTENPPPPSGDQAGMLVTADLPPIPKIDLPWLGTDAKPTTLNPSATTCDNADFGAAGATTVLARTFIIPGAQVPTRFGLSETLGEFANLTQAKGLFAQVVPRMDGCQDSDPGAHITASAQDADKARDSAYHLWRLQSEISDNKQIVYWMGIARVGSNVVQVSFVPGDQGQDLDQAGFTALVVRARDRLFELSTVDGSATQGPTSSASPSGKPKKSPSASPSNDSTDGADATPVSTAPALERASRLDDASPLRDLRARFVVPDGVVYLDGNSLGALPRGVAERVSATVTEEWGTGLIRAWNAGPHGDGWIGLARRVGDRIAPLVGAAPGDVHVGDSTSVSLFKTMVSALRLRPVRRVLVLEPSTFPTDGYVAEGVSRLTGAEVRWCDPADPLASVDDDVALLALTHVDFRTGAMFDLPAITAGAHERGALVQWDLCHSTGAVPVDLTAADADIAVGCTYKYLNGGPGSPAFTWVAPRLQPELDQPITGWMGHAAPFAMERDYRPRDGIARMASGTPPVLALSALYAALDAFDGVRVADLRSVSLSLTDLFVELVEERFGDLLPVITPREHARRGSQVSLRHPDAYGIVQALIARGVIGDFRDPDVARFGFAPAYVRHVDVVRAVDELGAVIDAGAHLDPTYAERSTVT